MASKLISLSINENLGRRLTDPTTPEIFHFEAFLRFDEANKLERGNANVRPPKENHPYKEMVKTVADSPSIFHLCNRGITYICRGFKYLNESKTLEIEIPKLSKLTEKDDDAPRYGIADGGHTFKVIQDTIARIEEFDGDEDWALPFVRVHFLASKSETESLEDIVEALNTSIQVKRFTLEEYRGKFDPLKDALTNAGFDVAQVGFAENDDKPWNVLEIIQRMACFLKERWKITPPSSMYRSKDKALQLFINDDKGEFSQLYSVVKDAVTLPEFIQATLSEHLDGNRKLGKVKGVKRLPKQYRRECTDFLSMYRMDNAIVLPMAAAFRSLLVLRKGNLEWRTSPYDVFKACAHELYQVLLNRVRRVKNVSQLAADQEYWMHCEKVVLATRDELDE